MPWNWNTNMAGAESAQGIGLGGKRGTDSELSSSRSWPHYKLEYLARKLGEDGAADRAKTDKYGAVNEMLSYANKEIYLDEAKKTLAQDADEELKREFNMWLQGQHPANNTTQEYINKDGKPARLQVWRDPTGSTGGGKGKGVGTQLTGWNPTWWGKGQLTHLPGVREYLAGEREGSHWNSYKMNVLAEMGPQNLDEAWQYFKHWVKGRPLTDADYNMDGMKPSEIGPRPPGGGLPGPEFAEKKYAQYPDADNKVASAAPLGDEASAAPLRDRSVTQAAAELPADPPLTTQLFAAPPSEADAEYESADEDGILDEEVLREEQRKRTEDAMKSLLDDIADEAVRQAEGQRIEAEARQAVTLAESQLLTRARRATRATTVVGNMVDALASGARALRDTAVGVIDGGRVEPDVVEATVDVEYTEWNALVHRLRELSELDSEGTQKPYDEFRTLTRLKVINDLQIPLEGKGSSLREGKWKERHFGTSGTLAKQFAALKKKEGKVTVQQRRPRAPEQGSVVDLAPAPIQEVVELD